MKANISLEGCLIIEVGSELEEYAMNKWIDDYLDTYNISQANSLVSVIYSNEYKKYIDEKFGDNQ